MLQFSIILFHLVTYYLVNFSNKIRVLSSDKTFILTYFTYSLNKNKTKRCFKTHVLLKSKYCKCQIYDTDNVFLIYCDSYTDNNICFFFSY